MEENEWRKVEVTIDTQEIADYFLEQLIARGYSPGHDELDDIADIVFDYLMDKGILEEESE
jgi:hypothetical protein